MKKYLLALIAFLAVAGFAPSAMAACIGNDYANVPAGGQVAYGRLPSGRWAPINLDSNCVVQTSGAGGGSAGAATIASGADVVEGASADAAACPDGSTKTLAGCLAQIHKDATSAIPLGGNRIGYTSDDPCAQGTKLTAHFSSTSSGGNLVTGTSGKLTYICGISIKASAGAHVSLCEATSTACSGGTPAAVYGNTGVTAANGSSYGSGSTGGGETFGNGLGTVAKTATAAQNIDVLFDTTNSPQVNVDVIYVQA